MTKNIFSLHRDIMADYKLYIESFINIADTNILNKVNEKLESGSLFSRLMPHVFTVGASAIRTNLRLSTPHVNNVNSSYSPVPFPSTSTDIAAKGRNSGGGKITAFHTAQLSLGLTSTNNSNTTVYLLPESPYITGESHMRYTISPATRKEVLRRLLELNHKIHAEEVAAGLRDKKKGGATKKGSASATVKKDEAQGGVFG